MLCGTIILSMIAWVVSARKWFKGPVSPCGARGVPPPLRLAPWLGCAVAWVGSQQRVQGC